ncbi:hypothetical protein [Xenorhabdus stockiae]|uniref:hypothetical protein n=1 Tax=Xenorhabdus stockiae TaxID=351614 RepID=UPI0014755AB9|nr:hypothetical protein [Xenorhabdus stockiae]
MIAEGAARDAERGELIAELGNLNPGAPGATHTQKEPGSDIAALTQTRQIQATGLAQRDHMRPKKARNDVIRGDNHPPLLVINL